MDIIGDIQTARTFVMDKLGPNHKFTHMLPKNTADDLDIEEDTNQLLVDDDTLAKA